MKGLSLRGSDLCGDRYLFFYQITRILWILGYEHDYEHEHEHDD